MYKNQLQELAQRSCFSLPSYVCTREGPDHAPRFKATVTFNGETFDGPSNCTTLRQAEHAAAEVALSRLSLRGPSSSLTARVLDETGVYKNLLQETAHRAGLKLPVYTTVRSGPGHSPVFSSTVELAGMSFVGDMAKTKKHAEKNAAMAAWSSLKQMPEARKESGGGGGGGGEEQEHGARRAEAAGRLRRREGGGGGGGVSTEEASRRRVLLLLRPVAVQTPMGASVAAAAVGWAQDTASPAPASAAAASGGVAPTRPFAAAAAGFHAPPAVSVRSVIPVCAAPPSPRPPARNEDDHPAVSPSSSSSSSSKRV
uniref:DRBM domain-containing protein n=1 Tax=Oryza punctata TaxID=4537 RepID=A0A0E0M357_ORYPU